jgi:hypothetical protein
MTDSLDNILTRVSLGQAGQTRVLVEFIVCVTDYWSHQIVHGSQGAVKELAHEIENLW